MASTPSKEQIRALKLVAGIIGHLGGKEFMQLTGAHQIRPIEFGARFRLPNYVAKKQINRVEAIVGVDGLMVLRFARRIKVNGKSHEAVIEQRAGLQVTAMASAFTEVTGLATEVL